MRKDPPLSYRDITCIRFAGEVEFNFTLTVCHHSPTGMEWGYSGSGPADLALNILNLFVPPGRDGAAAVRCFRGYCSRFAWDHHQEFKRLYVAGLPVAGGTIPGSAIRDFIAARLPGVRPLNPDTFQMELRE